MACRVGGWAGPTLGGYSLRTRAARKRAGDPVRGTSTHTPRNARQPGGLLQDPTCCLSVAMDVFLPTPTAILRHCSGCFQRQSSSVLGPHLTIRGKKGPELPGIVVETSRTVQQDCRGRLGRNTSRPTSRQTDRQTDKFGFQSQRVHQPLTLRVTRVPRPRFTGRAGGCEQATDPGVPSVCTVQWQCLLLGARPGQSPQMRRGEASHPAAPAGPM